MKKNNALTFDSLYRVVAGGKEKERNTILQADRSVLQRLIVATELVEKWIYLMFFRTS